jgi:hypothetical protein
MRRGIAVVLCLLVGCLLLLALASIQASSTLLRSSYYTRLLREADFYQFLMNDVTLSALDEMSGLSGEALSSQVSGNPFQALGISNQEVAVSVNRAFPREWVQVNAEMAMEQLGGYIIGERDEFEITIQAQHRVVVFGSELKTLITESDAYQVLRDEFITPAVTDVVIERLPEELSIDPEQAATSVERIVPEEWLEPQVEAAIDAIIAYLIGQEEILELKIPIDDRVDVALQEIKLLLRESDAYESVYQSLIEPMVAESFGDSIELPYGMVLTKEEIISAMREVAPPSWIQAQAERIIDDAAPYLKGESSGFATEISLVDNKRVAVQVVRDTAARKLRERLYSLPACTDQSPEDIIQAGLRGEIVCVPRNINVEALANEVGGEVSLIAERSIIDTVPDRIAFTEADLKETLTQAGVEDSGVLLEGLRIQVREGWIYTEDDLTRDVRDNFFKDKNEEEVAATISGLRQSLASGWTYTEVSFREDLPDPEDGDTLSNLDRMRGQFKLIRILGPVLLVLVTILLGGIGFLGGQDWQSRFTWVFGAVVAASIVALLIQVTLVEPRLEDLRAVGAGFTASAGENDNFPATMSLVSAKVFGMVESALTEFGSGIFNKLLIVLTIGIFGLLLALAWDYIVILARRRDWGLGNKGW